MGSFLPKNTPENSGPSWHKELIQLCLEHQNLSLE